MPRPLRSRPAARALVLFSLLLVPAACGPAEEEEGCRDGCSDHEACVDGACTCEDGFLDCDGRPENGCERAGGACECVEDAVSAFCEAHGAACGALTAAGRCGGERTVECGVCGEGEVCGAETPNVCGRRQVCEGEPADELCRAAGKDCGTYAATDSCGERRSVSCGSCASDEECRTNECVTRVLGDREACIRDGTWLGVCGEGLVCAGDDTDAVCMTVCRTDGDCPEGMGCAPGIWEDGTGSCGRFRAENESCHWIEDGVDFCYDPDAEAQGTYLACFASTCRYVCAAEGGAQLPCPSGHVCAPEWRHFADVGVDVRLCEAVAAVGERGVCRQEGVEVAPCAEGLSCVELAEGFGQCFRVCTGDAGCPEGQRCAVGFLESEAGICGELKGPGETGCDDVSAGRNFCWDFGAVPMGALLCLDSTCQYLCGLSVDPGFTAACPEGFACAGGFQSYPELPGLPAAVCEDVRLGEKEVCFEGGVVVEECRPGLECVGTDLRKVCQTVCDTDDACPEGRSCLAGGLADGRGTCVTYRIHHETCIADLDAGHEVCLDPAPPEGSSLECLGGTCQYVCHEEGSAAPVGSCPAPWVCSQRYLRYGNHPVRLAVCEPPCVPQTDSAVCAALMQECGTVTFNDCGTTRTADCGSCAPGSACNGRFCFSGNIPENGNCLDVSGNAVACAAGLTCVGWSDTVGTCKKQCYLDYECTAPQRCAEGVLSNGHGICGSFLAPGQYCDPMSTSSEFCWTTDAWDRVECLAGRCRQVCDVENSGDDWPCPMGMSCSTTFASYPGFTERLAICQ